MPLKLGALLNPAAQGVDLVRAQFQLRIWRGHDNIGVVAADTVPEFTFREVAGHDDG